MPAEPLVICFIANQPGREATMNGYKRVLLAIDFNQETEMLCERAAELAAKYQAQLALLHVVEPVVTESAYDILPALPAGFEAEMETRAQKALVRLGDRFGVPSENCHVEIGSTKSAIVRLAESLEIDLIIVGARGRHGMARLLGSTAGAILSSSPCDVLAVRPQQ